MILKNSIPYKDIFLLRLGLFKFLISNSKKHMLNIVSFSRKSTKCKDFSQKTIRYKALKKGIMAGFYIVISSINILKL